MLCFPDFLFFFSVLVKESTGQKLHPMFVCIATSGFSSALLSVSHKSDKVDTHVQPLLWLLRLVLNVLV